MFIKIDDINGDEEHIRDLRIVGHYCTDGKRQYIENLSQLKYYKPPKNFDRVHFNLDKDRKLAIVKPEENDLINSLLLWMSNHFDDIKMKNTSSVNRWLQPEIICYRGVLTTLLTTPYEKDDWIICATNFEGTIYLCAFDTDKTKQRKSSYTDYQKKSFAWGRKFEQYMLADHPFARPDTSVPLNENEEFCCIFQSCLGNTSLLYGAEMDGVCSKKPFTDTLVGKDVEFIELKTINESALDCNGPLPFRAFNALKWWCQSYLVGIKRIVCGSKQYKFVKKLQEIRTEELASNPSYDWKDGRCRSFCNGFLEKLKTIVREDHDKCLYKFTWNGEKATIEVEELKPVPDCEYIFLNPEYIAAAKRYKSNNEK